MREKHNTQLVDSFLDQFENFVGTINVQFLFLSLFKTFFLSLPNVIPIEKEK